MQYLFTGASKNFAQNFGLVCVITLPYWFAVDPKPYFPGYLIVVEGIDGAGKTTQAHFLQCALQERKLTAVRTKEPTTGQYGQMLRDSALTGRLSVEDEIDIFMKDRREHVEKLILPELNAGHIVIIDRYYFSTAAYQGARGVDPQQLIAKNEEFAPEPDLLFVLDLDPKTGLRRIRTRGDRANHFEKTATLNKARQIFLNISKPYKVVINAAQPVEAIRDFMLREFSQRYTEAIARSSSDLKGKLNATLALFGGDPVSYKDPRDLW